MQELKDRIIRDGRLCKGNVVKVDSFLNHMMDIKLINNIGREFKRIFSGCPVTKILTVEASGIGIACITAQYFDVPVVFAKKNHTINISDEVYISSAHSYTHNRDYNIMVSKDFLKSEDKVLIIDDFLANGCALKSLIEIVGCANAEVVGCGIVIEKAFQSGGEQVRSMGIRVESLAKIKAINEAEIEFC